MSIHTAELYSRRHELRFASSLRVVGSASVHVVPAAYCAPDAVDPEAAFVASLAGCHMLWFLSLAQAAGFRVDEYQDPAQGTLAQNRDGLLAMTTVTLRPHVRFDPQHAPDEPTHRRLHADAHAQCFIARSVCCELHVEPRLSLSTGG
jgi:organic hydroperoxide reductase OsmC/OhrA